MTKQEAILISAYTGFMLLPSGEFDLIHEACEKALGRPIWTHELANEEVHKEIRTALLPQIMALIDKEDT
jgi:hypothetical protein